MKIDPLSPQGTQSHERSVQMLNAARAYLSLEKVRAPSPGWSALSSLLATSKWLIIGQFQFVVKDCEIVRAES